MSRIVSVWLPRWPIERRAEALRRLGQAEDGRQPFALVEAGARGLRITAVNARAEGLGVRPGSALADARAALPSLATAPAEPEQDWAALASLVGWLGRYGPSRNREGPDGAWIDISGVAHLFGGEAVLLEDLVGRLRAQGFSARAGLADTPGAAHALSRFAPAPRVAHQLSAPARFAIAGAGHTREALAALPVEALRLAPASVQLLERLGLRRIGDLYGLPRAALARRFRDVRGRRRGPALDEPARGTGPGASPDGLAAAVLLRLDQALGLIGEPRAPLAEPPDTHVRLPFAEPLITGDGVALALDRLAGELCERLAALGLGGRRFVLRLYRVDGTVAEIATGTSRPCRDPAHLGRLLGWHLDQLDAGFGIDLVELAAHRLEPLTAAQISLGAREHDADVAALIDRLTGRLGAAAVMRIEAQASHIPERAVRYARPIAAPPGQPAIARPVESGADPAPEITRPARPAILLARPEPIAVVAEIPDGAPARLVWRRIARRIVKAEGPERIAPEWWQLDAGPGAGSGDAAGPGSGRCLARTRDYYRLEDETGGRYWVFRDGLYGGGSDWGSDEREPAWFMQGLFA